MDNEGSSSKILARVPRLSAKKRMGCFKPIKLLRQTLGLVMEATGVMEPSAHHGTLIKAVR